MTDVCGKSNGKWFSKKLCDLEPAHVGWCSWQQEPGWDSNRMRYYTGACKYNGVVAVFVAAGFVLEGDRGRSCNRCADYLTEFVKYGTSIAPSGFQARKPKEKPWVCLRCEEVCDVQASPVSSIASYLAPFLAENKSLTNNTIINTAIAKMQEDIVRLRACLEPELMAGKGAYRSLPQEA